MQCPTCKTPRDEDRQWQIGEHFYDGAPRPCNCAYQVELLEHYLLANIPNQYMRLDWVKFYGDTRARDAVQMLLKKWDPGFRMNGVGMEFAGPLGVGKTFAASAIAKELVKLGENVFFIQFVEVLEAIRYERLELLSQVKDAKVLVLDEIVSPPNVKLQEIFADHFEHIVRYRTNNNSNTIMTTNLADDEIHDHYSRVYSLLSAKQIRIEMDGGDARRGRAGNDNLERAINGEVAPIS